MFDKLFKRNKKKYILQIPRKGGSVVLAKIEAKDIDDAHNEVDKILEERAAQGDRLVLSSKYVHLINVDTGEKMKMPNPYYAGPEEEPERPRKTEPTPQDVINMALLDTTVSIIKTTVPTLMTQMVKGLGEAYAELGKELAKSAIQREQTSKIGELARLIQSLVLLADNYDKVKKMMHEASKDELLGMLLGTRRGEKSGETTESSSKPRKAKKQD